jgi:hypothetical protein
VIHDANVAFAALGVAGQAVAAALAAAAGLRGPLQALRRASDQEREPRLSGRRESNPYN